MRARFWIAQAVWLLLAAGLLATGNYFDAPVPQMIGVMGAFLVTGFMMYWGAPPRRAYNTDTTLIRAGMTGIYWFAYLGAVIYALETVGGIAVLLAFILFIPLVVLSLATWGVISGDSGQHENYDEYANQVDEMEKRKRERIDSVLRDLSDDDLVRLRDRLNDGSFDDEILYNRIVGDDGELIDYR